MGNVAYLPEFPHKLWFYWPTLFDCGAISTIKIDVLFLHLQMEAILSDDLSQMTSIIADLDNLDVYAAPNAIFYVGLVQVSTF